MVGFLLPTDQYCLFKVVFALNYKNKTHNFDFKGEVQFSKVGIVKRYKRTK